MPGSASSTSIPFRLHHNAYVVGDQRETQAFYEGLIGLPLIATWTEVEELFGAERSYCHTFYGLADGSALAFFQFADPEDHEAFSAKTRSSPFIHLALKVDKGVQEAVAERLDAAGWDHRRRDHGYCTSLYVTDPDGLRLELTCDPPDVEQINEARRQSAHDDLDRWLAGDHSSNNTYRTT